MSLELLRTGLSSVIRGKEEPLELFLAAIVSGGHVLLEDVPGTGKTSLARAAAKLIGTDAGALEFRRIQFTPDLLPYDVTGVDVYDPGGRRFFFQPGPVFAHIVLADEINRATPKVQSALLEVMSESQVTVGGTTYPLDRFFLVIATENPVSMEGTYPLPLAQLDRFMMRVKLGYPDAEAELSILNDDPSRSVLPGLTPVVTRENLLEERARAAAVFCDERIKRAVVEIARATRGDERVRYGASPRGALHLLDAARARAHLAGRDYVNESDLERLSVPVLAHRVRSKEPEVTGEMIVTEYTENVVSRMRHDDGVPA